ncbi:hypothetical protein HCZ30_05170 [Marivivens donghaensis]|uniref:Uncharacterized protein n=1 Tax=Marivivens donghaensis TaxID=1699413 RepID=A0ABX0VVI8_9RHOB|nr:hypothetical protein [Marivivens donghaensis]NIY71824.1 hypothetical protein [Marivivens donghaensis]
MAVAYWTEQMAQDNEETFNKARERERDAVLLEFIREARGQHGRRKKPAFISGVGQPAGAPLRGRKRRR